MRVGIVMQERYLELHGTQLIILQRFALQVTNAHLVLKQNAVVITRISKDKLHARHVLQAICVQPL
jgi:hypothetical protein